ncbi:hypothetical protein [Ralstonia pickettii]|uniref:hypothetical protein n=1 Tax=Ralstonia pickettii TaxID=329 RepID=UPI0015BDD140|nr:hypothetical protein [Ralstonia pickettii]NWK46029.1 hypothetical protein [Ralstonia pickettii]
MASNTVKLKAVGLLVFAAVGLLSVAERLYLVNGAHYPSFLAKDVGNVDMDRLGRLRAAECGSEPVEVYAKSDYWVLRCGVAYISGRTFISHTDPFEKQ